MIVAIHQPEHFPYMGFFQKMEASDLFVILDNVKFRKNYFQNRNKIRSISGKDEWFTVPVVKKDSSKMIKDVRVSNVPGWRKKIIKQFQQNLSIDVSEFYYYDKLIDINMSGIKWAMRNLNIDKDILFASELGATGSKTELLVNILKEVGAKRYLSGPAGKDYLDVSLFDDIHVDFFEPQVENFYSCLYNIALLKRESDSQNTNRRSK